MKALDRCREPGWIEQRVISMFCTFLIWVFFVLASLLVAIVWESLPQFTIDWIDVVLTAIVISTFIASWRFIDEVLWS